MGQGSERVVGWGWTIVVVAVFGRGGGLICATVADIIMYGTHSQIVTVSFAYTCLALESEARVN